MPRASSPAGRAPRLPVRGRRAAWAAALLLLGLGGCGGGGSNANTFPPNCPHAGILADAADLTRYRPGAAGHDLTDTALDGRITGVSGACARGGRGELDVTVAVSMQLVRGPAAGAGVREVPFFVAVARGGQVLDKQIYRVVPGFAPNADALRLTSEPVSLTVPVTPERPGSTYDIVVGFQLTPDEVAANRRRGPR